jgi:hypothetical protein
MSEHTNREILQDMHGRMYVIEGYVEGLMAQQREWLALFRSLGVDNAKLLEITQRMTKHTERLVREKDQLAATLGRIIYTRFKDDEITR